MSPLSRPVWQSLTGYHARFSTGNDLARRFLPDVNMFASPREDTRDAMQALAQLNWRAAARWIKSARPRRRPPMSAELETRIEQLEMTLAHQDQMIEDLNGVILSQREEIDRLTRRLNKLMSRVDALEDAAPGPEANKPPHW